MHFWQLQTDSLCHINTNTGIKTIPGVCMWLCPSMFANGKAPCLNTYVYTSIVIVSPVTTPLFWVITQQVVEITITCCIIVQKSSSQLFHSRILKIILIYPHQQCLWWLAASFTSLLLTFWFIFLLCISQQTYLIQAILHSLITK